MASMRTLGWSSNAASGRGSCDAQRERLLVDRRDFGVLRFALRVAMVALRVLLRVPAAEPVLLALGRFALPRLVVVLPRLAAAFFVAERVLRLRSFFVVPVTVSAMALAALETPPMAASMLVLAASVIAPRMSSFSLSMLFTFLRVTL
jgi:hypothetical protein